MGAPKPRSKVVLLDAAGEVCEELSVPKSVGRALDAYADKVGEPCGSRAELLYWIGQVAERCAWDRLLGLVDRRDYSTTEVDEKLRLDGYSSAARSAAIQRACDSRIIDDARFADVFIRSKVMSGWGVRRIERELARKGVDPSCLAEWPDGYLDGQDEAERAYELIEYRRVSERNGFEKLVRYLVSRGYATGVACDAARRRVEANQDN